MSSAVENQKSSALDAEIARVNGLEFSIPADLYIPPDAFQLMLESFEGPLDLLLYLIRKQKIEILELNVTHITAQYLEYMGLMQELKIDLAAEYMLMAATLIEIKSRLLLPKPEAIDELLEEDPRAALIRRLQVYEQFKLAADNLNALPRMERDLFYSQASLTTIQNKVVHPRTDLEDILQSLSNMSRRKHRVKEHLVALEVLSVRERMSKVLSSIVPHEFREFTTLYQAEEGRSGIVVSLLAILELQRQRALLIKQVDVFSTIYVKAIVSEVVNED